MESPLLDFKEDESKGVTLRFQVNGKQKTVNADLVVGADGIRSTVRSTIGDEQSPLRYLGCIVIRYLSFKCFSRNE
jgi:2-polyprenyl-6-methoxyphenol hydroxylase-like FAD-dependent oxidoreductase